MRKGWEYKSFETCINKLPKPKQVKTSEYSSGTKYPIISQEDKLISGYYDDESYVFHIDSPVVIFGDHTRVLKYVDFDFVVGADGVKIISPKRELNAKFLLYYLQWYKIPNLGYSRHYKLLKEIKIPLPPLSTQLAIVSELDKINELIRLKKEQLKDFDNLAQSLFYEMFGDPVENEKGWEVKKLGDICSQITDGTHNSPTNTEKGDFMYVTAKNIKRDGIILDNITYVDAATHQSIYLRCNPEYGDVLYIKDGATTGIATINNLKEEFSLLSSVALLKLGDEIVNYYLKAVLNTQSLYNSIRSNMGGAAITRLTLVKIKAIRIPLPPIPLQRLFAQRIEQIEREKSEVQKSIQDLETLLASRMQYWFE